MPYESLVLISYSSIKKIDEKIFIKIPLVHFMNIFLSGHPWLGGG